MNHFSISPKAALCPVNVDRLREDASAEIERVLEQCGCVYIPPLDFPVMLSRPVALDSGMTFSAAPETVFRMKPGCGGCMIRNRHVLDRRLTDAPCGGYDADIQVEGGIWEEAPRSVSAHDPDPVMRSLSEYLLGVVFFSHAERVSVRGMTFRRGSQYGVLLADCHEFHVSNLFFDDYGKDGVHVNGPSDHGLIEDIRGHCSDDFVALNAWDWDSSAVSFGAISSLTVRRIACDHDEMRLLPGRKTYKSGLQTDCPVTDCIFEDISGVYNFKMYQQPNCHNAHRLVKDRSDIAGRIDRVRFSRIRLERLTAEGLAEVRLDAVFEMGADCSHISFDRVTLGIDAAYMKNQSMTLVAVGPKSSTWTQGSADPTDWCELFEPDLICTADALRFKDICLGGVPCRDESVLIKANHLTPNADYPHTRPMGGTGYGILKNIVIEP